VAAAALTIAMPARADEAPVPPPSFAAGRQRLSEDDLREKVEGAYFTGLPLVDSDPDTGFGFGARGYRYWDGSRDDPLYAYTPYRHRVYAQAFATTNGYQFHAFDYDAPYLGDSPYRLRASLYFERNTAANYFGRGAATLGPLAFQGATTTYASFANYSAALAGAGLPLYDKFTLTDPGVSATVERDFVGGLVRAQAGVGSSVVSVRTYPGATRLGNDCATGRVVGCAGGLHDTIKVGMALDTRDYEPDPNSGVFVDATGEISSRLLGSSWDYARMTVSPRVFVSPIPELTDLVVAARAVLSVQTEGVPFQAMNTLAFTDGDRQGLGGLRTLRGYKQDRFVGPMAALANAELRWTFVSFTVGNQRFGLSAAPFVDVGRVFDRVSDFALGGWRRGQGGGLRIAWNKATIVVVDYGVSTEDSGLYMDFGHQF
jgi:outer membrane protein assembly factor BamA